MKTFLKWLVFAPVALALAVFALFNRQNVPVVLDPFGTDVSGLRFEAPLFFVMLVCAALGLLAGGFIVWLSQGKHRRAARSASADVAQLNQEVDRLRAQAAANANPALPAPIRNAA